MAGAEIQDPQAGLFSSVRDEQVPVAGPHLVPGGLLGFPEWSADGIGRVLRAEGASIHFRLHLPPGEESLDAILEFAARLLDAPDEAAGIQPGREAPPLRPARDLASDRVLKAPFRLRIENHQGQPGRIGNRGPLLREENEPGPASAGLLAFELPADELPQLVSDLFLVE